MAETGLRGPFPLTNQSIDRYVQYRSPGAYTLDRKGDPNAVYVYYAGRSDVDINRRLKDHVGNYYTFKFEYYSTAKEAFEKECNLYHDFNPPDNNVHPARPTGSNWKCPRCFTFG